VIYEPRLGKRHWESMRPIDIAFARA